MHKAVMVAEFDGYRFVEGQQESMFNPQLALFYLDALARKGTAPEPLVDPNVVNPSDNVAKFLLFHHKAPDTFGTSAAAQFLFGDFPASVRADLGGSTLFSENDELSESALITLAYHHGFLTYPPPGETVPVGRRIVPVERFLISMKLQSCVRDRVLQKIRMLSEQYGHIFANMYDMSGANENTVYQHIKTDWIHLVDDLKITDSVRYLHHNKRILVLLSPQSRVAFNARKLANQRSDQT
eukprot:scaffold131500_cov32-Attheya_sp.AAC.5